MKQRPRIYYTEKQKSLMWDRWKKGKRLPKGTLPFRWLLPAQHSKASDNLNRRVA